MLSTRPSGLLPAVRVTLEAVNWLMSGTLSGGLRDEMLSVSLCAGSSTSEASTSAIAAAIREEANWLISGMSSGGLDPALAESG